MTLLDDSPKVTANKNYVRAICPHAMQKSAIVAEFRATPLWPNGATLARNTLLQNRRAEWSILHR